MRPVYVFSIASSYMTILKRFKVEFDLGHEATIYTTDGTPLQSISPLIPPRPHSETLAETNICRHYWQFLWRQGSRIQYFPHTRIRVQTFAAEATYNGMFGVTWNNIQPPELVSSPPLPLFRRKRDYEHALQEGY